MKLEEYLISLGKKPKSNDSVKEKNIKNNPAKIFSENNSKENSAAQNPASNSIQFLETNTPKIFSTQSDDSFTISIFRKTTTSLPTFAERDLIQFCIKYNIPYMFVNYEL